MVQFLILIVLSVAQAGVTRTLDLNRLNPRQELVDGVVFPRVSETKYRGTTEIQMDRARALKAMLGGNSPIESILFSATRLLLMKESVPFYAEVKASLESRGLHNKIKLELLKNNDRPFEFEKAQNIAFHLIEDDLMEKIKTGYFVDHYVDYRSPHYELFPQDIIFSTVYLEVANIYSRFITVIEDAGQMLDLNYWNRSRNGAWVFTSRKWVDRGEFISPIIIEAEKISGFLEYFSQVPDWRIFRPLPNELDIAFMKHQEGNEIFVLLLDGTHALDKAPAILKVQDLYHQADSQFAPEADVPKQLKSRKGTSFLIGVLKLCPLQDSCKIKTSLFSKYRRSQRVMDSKFTNLLKNLNIEDKRPKLFYIEETIPQNKISTSPYKVSYPSSEKILEDEMRSSFSGKDLKNSPDRMDAHSITWDLKGKKLQQDEAIFFNVPDSYRTKKLLRVSLLQRQDEADNTTPLKGRFDNSPAYTSVQFYALTEETSDKWRYWGGTTKFNNPKGSFFANIISEADMEKQTLETWNNTKGHLTDRVLNRELFIGGVRILGVGTDPARIHRLHLEFEK